MEQFVKIFENLYTEFIIENDKNNEKINLLIKEFSKKPDCNDMARKIYSDSNELRQKFKEYDQHFKEKKSSSKDGSFSFE